MQSCTVKYFLFHFTQYLCNSKIFALNTVFIKGNKRNRRSRRVESQSSDRDENTSETSFTQGNASLVDVSENVNNIFDRNLGSELTELSQNSNEIDVISQRLAEQNNNKMTQLEQQLNNKFEEILKEIRTNRNSNLVNGEEDAENNRPSTSNSENKFLRRKHASNNEIDKDTHQDSPFQFSEMYELKQPSTPFGVANGTLDDTIIISENRQEADYHNWHYDFFKNRIVFRKKMIFLCFLLENACPLRYFSQNMIIVLKPVFFAYSRNLVF